MPKSTRASARISKSKLDIASSTSCTRAGRRPLHRDASHASIAKATSTRRTSKPPTLTFLARSPDVINADPNRLVRLFAIPQELLEHIASHLPLVSVICLTLTCKAAAEAIGTQSWANYKKEKRWAMDRNGFIELLARDWGDILDFCPRCDTLHPPLQPPRSHRETKLTKWCFGQDAMIDYLPHDASHGYNPVFEHIANAVEESKSFASKGSAGPPIDTLSGQFMITKNNLSWSLDSSSRRTDGNLILRHVHIFRSRTNNRLNATDLLALPIRLCPHQSTTTATPVPYHHSNHLDLRRSRSVCVQQNGRLLTGVINSAFPVADRASVDLKALKPLTPSEQAQVSVSQAGEEVYWRCRSCPTKYRVTHSRNQFTITSWHSFGRDLYHALKYWKWMVRRTGTTLGPDKRNDEWWSQRRTVPDFVCE